MKLNKSNFRIYNLVESKLYITEYNGQSFAKVFFFLYEFQIWVGWLPVHNNVEHRILWEKSVLKSISLKPLYKLEGN